MSGDMAVGAAGRRPAQLGSSRFGAACTMPEDRQGASTAALHYFRLAWRKLDKDLKIAGRCESTRARASMVQLRLVLTQLEISLRQPPHRHASRTRWPNVAAADDLP